MTDANQRWDVEEAIEWMKPLAKYNLLWIEEPTSPDDVLGHLAISKVYLGDHVFYFYFIVLLLTFQLI